MENTISSQRPIGLADWVCQQIKDQILNCTLAPGTRIIENDLCLKLGISRTPLREALNRLSQEGLVTLVTHRGFQVTPITVQYLRDLCELRRIVESEAAHLAALRAQPHQIPELRHLAGLPYVPGDRKTYEKYLRNNTAFHFLVAQCSQNARLESLVLSLMEQLQRPMYLGLDLGMDSAAATAEHLDLVNAIENRDATLARKIMADQLANTERRIIDAAEASAELTVPMRG